MSPLKHIYDAKFNLDMGFFEMTEETNHLLELRLRLRSHCTIFCWRLHSAGDNMRKWYLSCSHWYQNKQAFD